MTVLLGRARRAAALLAAACCAAGCGAGGRAALVEIYAASSLREVLGDLAPSLERAAGRPVVFNFGASGDLARQILAARRADLFASADPAEIDRLEAAGLIAPGTRRLLAANRLVLIEPASEPAPLAGISDLARADVARVAIADPAFVPAGRYARAWLERAGVWEAVAPKIVPGIDVRAALEAVASGGVRAGIVYRTEAALGRPVRVAAEAAEGEAPRIEYAAAALAGSPAGEAALAVLELLGSEAARAAFERRGFGRP